MSWNRLAIVVIFCSYIFSYSTIIFLVDYQGNLLYTSVNEFHTLRQPTMSDYGLCCFKKRTSSSSTGHEATALQGIILSDPQNTTNLWDQTWSEVNKFIGGDAKVQLIHPFINCTPHKPSSGESYIDATLWTIVNQLPQWTTVAKYSPAATGFYATYKKILQSHKPKLTLSREEEQEKLLAVSQRDITTAQSALIECMEVKNREWRQALQVLPGIPPPSYETWLLTSGWEKRLNTDSVAIDQLALNKAEIVADPYYKEVMEACALPTEVRSVKPGFIKSDVNSIEVWRPNYILHKGKDWIDQLTNDHGTISPLKICLDASKKMSDMKSSWSGGSIDCSNSFFSLFSQGLWQDMYMLDSDKSIKVDINIKTVSRISVCPDKWFRSEYIRILADESSGVHKPIFGKGGQMPLMVAGVIAGCHVSFKLTMSSSMFDCYKSDFMASSGIRIGPFHIGGGYHTAANSWVKKIGSTSFSGESKSNSPFIFGLIVSEPEEFRRT